MTPSKQKSFIMTGFINKTRQQGEKAGNVTQPSATLPLLKQIWPGSTTASSEDIKEYAAKMDAVRLWAICSIVWGHCLFGWENQVFHSKLQQALQSFLMELGRVGTISFFLISGFFLAGKLQKFTVISYLRYRLYSVIIPWFIFIVLFVLIQLGQLSGLHGIVANPPLATLTLLKNLFGAAVLHAAFWFVPVSVLSACLLIMFSKYVRKWWFGLLLCCVTLFYCINLYHGWISVNHARSAIGYTFFMWLGKQTKNQLVYLKTLVHKLNWQILLPVMALMLAFSCREGWYLKSTGCADPYASIRFSNIVFSLFVFIAMLKTNSLKITAFINPHKYGYGIYLVHSVVLLKCMPLMAKFVSTHQLFASLPLAVLVQIVFFLFIISISFFIVWFIKISPLRFMVGRA